MNYILINKGEMVAMTNHQTSPESIAKCEQLRLREVSWIRLGDVKADRCLGVIEGGKDQEQEKSTA